MFVKSFRRNSRLPVNIRNVNLVRVIAFSFAFFVFLPQVVYADIGVPMIGFILPASWVLLVPVIIIEALVARKYLGTSWVVCIKVSGIANSISTLIGVPISWVSLVIVQCIIGGSRAWGIDTIWHKILAVTVQSPWLIPYDSELHWMYPAAAAFLCIPFFLISVLCEYLIARRFFDSKQWAKVQLWSWVGNAISYGMLILYLLYRLIVELHF